MPAVLYRINIEKILEMVNINEGIKRSAANNRLCGLTGKTSKTSHTGKANQAAVLINAIIVNGLLLVYQTYIKSDNYYWYG